MRKNVNVSAVIFRTIFVTLGVVGILSSLGWFNREYNINWYVFYTNLSNYICIIVMFISLIFSAKGKDTVLPRFRFYCLIMILVTFFVYNILLSNEHTPYTYFTDISCTLLHCVLPIMYFLDWLLFCKRNTLKVVDPILSVIMPLIYVAYIVIRSSLITHPAKGVVIYPYFFLNLGKLGWSGFLGWVGVLLAIFIALGYILYMIDKVIKGKNKSNWFLVKTYYFHLQK